MATDLDLSEAAYEKTIKQPTPLDPVLAKERLKEIKQVFDELRIVFWLGSGTCLGAIRESRFIPWDDEMDTASVIGLHGLTEDVLEQAIRAFSARGFYPHVGRNERYIGVSVVKGGIRADWTCHRIVDGVAYEFPGVKLPLSLFEKPKQIEFIGEKFLVPNPPEEYLRLKYGSEWMVPKGPGFESDVVTKIRDGELLSLNQKFRQILATRLFKWSTGSLRVLDKDGEPVKGAEVVIVGVGRSQTNKNGYARIHVPDEAYYAVMISYDHHKEILYEEVLKPQTPYTYRPGPIVTAEQHYKAGVRAMALTRD